jgi:hypothetical protein
MKMEMRCTDHVRETINIRGGNNIPAKRKGIETKRDVAIKQRKSVGHSGAYAPNKRVWIGRRWYTEAKYGGKF